MKAKDDEIRQELEDTKRELEEKVMKIKKASEGMPANFAAEKEKKKMADRMREIVEREWAKIAHDEKLAAIRDQLERTPTAPIRKTAKLFFLLEKARKAGISGFKRHKHDHIFKKHRSWNSM